MSTHTHTHSAYDIALVQKKSSAIDEKERERERRQLKEQRGDEKQTKNIKQLVVFEENNKKKTKKNLVDHCCTATYKHQSISLHHTIDKTDNMSLHINNTRKDDAHTHTNTNDRLAVKERSYLKNTHTHKYRKKKNWCAAMRSYEPEDCIEKKRQNTVMDLV